jgi:hypothetical protein
MIVFYRHVLGIPAYIELFAGHGSGSKNGPKENL